jgi:hypothetical protein
METKLLTGRTPQLSAIYIYILGKLTTDDQRTIENIYQFNPTTYKGLKTSKVTKMFNLMETMPAFKAHNKLNTKRYLFFQTLARETIETRKSVEVETASSDADKRKSFDEDERVLQKAMHHEINCGRIHSQGNGG